LEVAKETMFEFYPRLENVPDFRARAYAHRHNAGLAKQQT
jgi:hypothetical protein